MAIELRLTGECKGCPALDVQIMPVYAGGEIVEVSAICNNQGLCAAVRRHLKAIDPLEGRRP